MKHPVSVVVPVSSQRRMSAHLFRQNNPFLQQTRCCLTFNKANRNVGKWLRNDALLKSWYAPRIACPKSLCHAALSFPLFLGASCGKIQIMFIVPSHTTPEFIKSCFVGSGCLNVRREGLVVFEE